LRRAGVIEASSPSGLATSLTDPSLVGHLTTCLAAAAGVPAEDLNQPPGALAPGALAPDALSSTLHLTRDSSFGVSSTLHLTRDSSFGVGGSPSLLLGGSQLPRAEPRVVHSSELRQHASRMLLPMAPAPAPLNPHAAVAEPASVSGVHAAIDAAAALANTRVVDCRFEGVVGDAERCGGNGRAGTSIYSSTGSSSGSTSIPHLLSLVAQNELLAASNGASAASAMRALPPYLPAAVPRVVKGHES